MKAEIVSIGDEILIGQIHNTNSVWIAEQLNLMGIQVVQMSTISDDQEVILSCLESATKRADIVFITGGLGPTKDDVTKMAFSTFFNAELIMDNNTLEQVQSFFKLRGRAMSKVNEMQALVPSGCVVIPNKNGTAPGMWMLKNKVVFISMPGVPYEMKAMMEEVILPKIKNEFSLAVNFHKTVHTIGIPESVLAEKLNDWEDALAEKNIKLAYLPQPGIVRLRISSSGKDISSIQPKIENEINDLQKLIGENIFGIEEFGQSNLKMEHVIIDLLKKHNATVALAESCTGGYLASLFTAVPGVSEVLKGGIVPYCNEAKMEIVGVSSDVISQHGAVSKECVEQLSINTLQKFKSDYAISISGVAGPDGGSEEKPVGFVWISVASKNKLVSKSFRFGDNRSRNIVMFANTALNMLRIFILKNELE
ncbi:MAG: competence/damage-inducible protein A [Sphingobacteriaceae bacterium]|nr:competence/damage-inducible protein A [Sphingobacteriaceae bacterium]